MEDKKEEIHEWMIKNAWGKMIKKRIFKLVSACLGTKGKVLIMKIMWLEDDE